MAVGGKEDSALVVHTEQEGVGTGPPRGGRVLPVVLEHTMAWLEGVRIGHCRMVGFVGQAWVLSADRGVEPVGYKVAEEWA